MPGGDGTVRLILERARVVLRDDARKPLRIAGTHSDVTERRELEDQIRFQATHDYLTGLPNRYLFYDRFSQAIAYARRKKRKVSLLFIDLDNFKVVNDTYGHDVGDDLLKEAAERLRKVFREMDTICRLGGDEFTVILPETGDCAEVQRIAERLLSSSILFMIQVRYGSRYPWGSASSQMTATISRCLKRRTSPCTARRNTKSALPLRQTHD